MDQAQARRGRIDDWLRAGAPPRAWLRLAALAAVAALAVFSLRSANVNLPLQAKMAIMLALATLAGAAFIAQLRPQFPDPVLFWLTAYLLGLFLLSLSAFVSSQTWLWGGVPLAAAPGRPWIGLGGLGLLALTGLAQLILARREPWPRLGVGPVVVLMAGAIVINAVVHRGFYDFLPPNPAHGIDHVNHVVNFPDTLWQAGLPEATFRHRGLELLLIQAQSFSGEPYDWHRVQAYKLLSLVAFFTVAYAGYALGRYGFDLNRRWATLAGGSTLAFSAIAPMLWSPSPTAYLGFYSPSATFYHNATQLFGHGLAATGLVLIALAWRRQARLFAVGGALLGCSLFFKPTFLYDLAPALLVLLVLSARRLTRDEVYGYAAVAAALAGWFVYPTLTHSTVLNAGYALRPFDWSLRYIPANYAGPLFAQPLVVIPLALVLSFAFPLAVTALRLSEGRWPVRAAWEQVRQRWGSYRFELLLLLFFGAALLIATLLVERNEPQSGNQVWGLASATLCLLPLFIRGAAGLRRQWARCLVWGLFALHLFSSARHIFRLLLLGEI